MGRRNGDPLDRGTPSARTTDQLLSSPGPKYLTASRTDPGLHINNINPFLVKKQIDNNLTVTLKNERHFVMTLF